MSPSWLSNNIWILLMKFKFISASVWFIFIFVISPPRNVVTMLWCLVLTCNFTKWWQMLVCLFVDVGVDVLLDDVFAAMLVVVLVMLLLLMLVQR